MLYLTTQNQSGWREAIELELLYLFVNNCNILVFIKTKVFTIDN